MTLLSLLTLSCFRSDPVEIDFGDGKIELPKKFQHRSGYTERDPDSVRHHFQLVNDTHWSGQTSYAEELVVSIFSPRLGPKEFGEKLAARRYDALSTIEPYSVEKESGLEWQFSTVVYGRHPVKEAAILVRLIDPARRVMLGWYGYQKRFPKAKAMEQLRAIHASLQVEESLASRFEDYEKWAGNEWMEAYFANQPLLLEALRTIGLALPNQANIWTVSTWERKGRYLAAIDGEKPSYLHLVDLEAADGCAKASEIAPGLRYSFGQQFEGGKVPECFGLKKWNLWEKQGGAGNPILKWMEGPAKR